MAYQLQSRIRAAIGEPERPWGIEDTRRVRPREWGKLVGADKYQGEPEYRVIEVSASALATTRRPVRQEMGT